jgi:hypothetical protein
MTSRLASCLAALVLAAGAAAAQAEPVDSIRIGGDVRVTEATSGALTALGGNVEVEAPVAGPLRVAGGDVKVGPDATIGGTASIAGGDVSVKGPINGNLRVAGGEVTLDGPVTGNASIASGSLTLGPNARIGGMVEFHGGELHRDPAAQVTGGIIEHARGNAMRHQHELTPLERFTRGWAWSAGLVVLAALLAGALPGPSQRLANELRERPWMSALLGLLAFSAIPVAAVLVMITIIGIPIGLLALALYAVLLLVGYVWLAVVIGGLILERVSPETAALTAWRVGAAVLAMLAFAILARVPYFGGPLKMAALVVGVGMITAAVFRARQQPQAATI